MGEYLGEKPYDFAVMVFDGPDAANEAFEAEVDRRPHRDEDP